MLAQQAGRTMAGVKKTPPSEPPAVSSSSHLHNLRQRLSRLLPWLPALAVVALTACGGSDDAQFAHVRLLNASPGYNSLDLYLDDDRQAAAIATGAVSSYADVDPGTYNTSVRRADSATDLATVERGYSEDSSYTLVAYGWEGSLKTYQLTDSEDSPGSGLTRVRVFNTATDAGTLDVYLTDSNTELTDATPIASSVAGASLSAYKNLSSGSWRLRVTGNDDATDVRLDLSAVALASNQVVTVVLTPGSGGVLVNAIVLVQGGSATAYNNPSARVRLVAGSTGNATHSAVVAGTTLTAGTPSPAVGSYILVNAGGAQSLDLQVNGSRLSTTTVSLSAGGDYSLLVHGASSAPQLAVLSDNNRLPSSSSQAKLRLVNGAYNLAGGLTLNLDYDALASDIAAGSASSYKAVTASSGSTMTVDLSGSSLAGWTDLSITAKAVYSVFVLGEATAPTAVLRRDR